MSDTSDDLTYTRSNITFSPDLAPREGEVALSEDEAVKVLMRRLGVSRPRSEGARFWNTVNQGLDLINPFSGKAEGDNNRIRDDLESSPVGMNLVTHIVRTFPPEALTESVLLNVDVRPILSDLILHESQAERNPRAVKYINDVPFAADERVVAGYLLIEQDRVVEDQAIAAATAMEAAGEFGEQGTDEARQAREDWILQQTDGWRDRRQEEDGNLGATPALILEQQEETATLEERDAVADQIASQSLYEQQLAAADLVEMQNAYNFMDEEQMQWMFQMEMVQWNDLILNERNKKQARAEGMPDVPADFMVDTGGLAGTSTPSTYVDTGSLGGIEDASAGRTGAGGSSVRLLDVFNSLYRPERTRLELRNVQNKLIAGGYLDEDDVRYWGMGTDRATQAAWRLLVQDSINTGTDMASLLMEATEKKRDDEEEEAKKNQRDLLLSSSAGIQVSADALGQSVLGRRLSESDHARLIEMIHSLERDQHTTLAPEGGQEAEAVDINAEIERYLYGEHGAEAGAYDLLEQVDVFTNFVTRPGA